MNSPPKDDGALLMTVQQAHRMIPSRSHACPVVVAGAGPVGLVTSLLLSNYRVHHLLIDENRRPVDHPQAHFINCRSMEILRELDRLDQVVLDRCPPLDEWRRFVYCTNLSDLPPIDGFHAGSRGSLLGVVDHFADGAKHAYSPTQVAHFPQHDFVHLLRKNARKRKYCTHLEGHRADIRETSSYVFVTLTDLRSGLRHVVKPTWVIAADGAHSSIRAQLGIDCHVEKRVRQHLINVHFISRELSQWLQPQAPAMLYFIYSTVGVGVLVAHSLSRGEFVAQLPYFPLLQPLATFSERNCVELIQGLVGRPIRIQVLNIRRWRLRVGLASRFRSTAGRCFLVGDAAHQFTPAGGFGMNTGIQDAHNLVWKLATVLHKNDQGNIIADPLLRSYEAERMPVARNNALWSIENYLKTCNVPNALGLSPMIADGLNRLVQRLPIPQVSKRHLFAAVMALGLRQVGWLQGAHVIARRRKRAIDAIFADWQNRTLRLLFPGQDIGFVYGAQGANELDINPADPFGYTPRLRVGARMPHFWINSPSGKCISSLDLPSLLVGEDAVPRHILVASGVSRTELKACEEAAPLALTGFSKVRIHAQPDASRQRQFTYFGSRPLFLPRSFVVLMRPDGHIAWLREKRLQLHN